MLCLNVNSEAGRNIRGNWCNKLFWYTQISLFFSPVVSFSSCPAKKLHFHVRKQEEQNKRGKDADMSSSMRLAWMPCVYTVIMKIFNTELLSNRTEHLRSKEKIKWAANQWEKGRILYKNSFQKALFIPKGPFQGEPSRQTIDHDVKQNKILRHMKSKSRRDERNKNMNSNNATCSFVYGYQISTSWLLLVATFSGLSTDSTSRLFNF